MTVTFIGTNAAVTGTTTITPVTIPGFVAGDLGVLVVINRGPTAPPLTPSVTTPASGWTLLGSVQGGSGAYGAGTGPTRVSVYTRTLVGGDGSVTLDLNEVSIGMACISVFRTDGGPWQVAMSGGADTTDGTSFSVTAAADPDIAAADMVLLGYGVADATSWTVQAITATGATFGTVTERVDTSTTTSNDATITVASADVTAGTSSAAAVITGTLAAASSGAAVVVRVRSTAAVIYASKTRNQGQPGPLMFRPQPRPPVRIPLVSNDVFAQAEAAEVSVVSNNATGLVALGSGFSAATVASNNTTSTVKPGANNAPVTTTANNSSGLVSLGSGFAPVVVVANAPSKNATPSTATVSVVANNSTGRVSTTPTTSPVTAVANNSTGLVSTIPATAPVGAVAFNPTVSTQSTTNAPAGLAAVSAIANQPTITVASGAGLASLQAVANAITGGLRSVNAGNAPVGATSNNPTVTTSGGTSAPAGNAPVTVASNNPSITTQGVIGNVNVQVTVEDSSRSILVSAGIP